MTPPPVYTFLVNTIDYQVIYSQPLPDNIGNMVENLNSQAVYVPYVNRPLKNGDVFTLFGKRAQTVYDMFINKTPKVLELISNTNDIPSIITNNFTFDPSSLPISSAISNYYEKYILNYSGKAASFLISGKSSEGYPVEFSLKINNIEDSNSPSSSFDVLIEDRSLVCLSLNSASKFFVTYSQPQF